MSNTWGPPDEGSRPTGAAYVATSAPVAPTFSGSFAVASTDQQPQPVGVVVVAWVLAVVTVGYSLPWAIAVTRGKSNQTTIALVNLLTGWTLVGWIIALVMACGPHQPIVQAHTAVVTQQFSQVPAGWYPAPDGLGRQYWDGRQWTPHRAD